MDRVSIEALDAEERAAVTAPRRISTALGAEHVAVNHYTVAPGERVSGLHAHGDQEELFVVLEGTATVETLDGQIVVEAGEILRVAPGEYQSVTNDETRALEVLAIGAPRDSDDVRIPLPCPECGHEFREPTLKDSGPALACPECGDETLASCAACGGEDLYAAIGHRGDPVSICADCGAATPPDA